MFKKLKELLEHEESKKIRYTRKKEERSQKEKEQLFNRAFDEKLSQSHSKNDFPVQRKKDRKKK